MVEVLKVDAFEGKEVNEIQNLMSENITEYEASIETLTMDQLEAEEANLMEVMKENEDRMAGVKYELAKEAEYDGLKYKAGEIANFIINFLNRLEVEWKAALGIHQCIRFWKTRQPDEKVSYAAYDSTLRLLGTLKFKGEQDCFNILLINNFLSSAHRGYIIDTAYIHYLAGRHQAIMNAMNKLESPAEAIKD